MPAPAAAVAAASSTPTAQPALLGPPLENQFLHAIPGEDTNVPLWILGSSLFGAQLAAMLGLPYTFASHFAPQALLKAVEIYRERFEPSEQLDRPHVMLGINLVAAETDEEARFLKTSVLQSFVNLRRGTPGMLPPPIAGYEDSLMPAERSMLDQALSCSIAGAPDTVASEIAVFIEKTGADEIMITSNIHDHDKRLHSFKLVAEMMCAGHAALPQ